MSMLTRMLKSIGYSVLPDSFINRIRKNRWQQLFAMKNMTLYEPELALLPKLVTEGYHVIDIGANYGIYTHMLSKLVGETGKVFSVEPTPYTREILTENVTSYGLQNVDILQYALSDAAGTLEMYVPRFATGGQNYYKARIGHASEADHQRYEVDVSTLDAEFATSDVPISFVKMDVEGHELKCLQGGKYFIERFHPVWLMEISGDLDESGSPAHQVVEIMKSHGYTVYVLTDDLCLRERETGEQRVNYFMLTEEHITALQQDNLIN